MVFVIINTDNIHAINLWSKLYIALYHETIDVPVGTDCATVVAVLQNERLPSVYM